MWLCVLVSAHLGTIGPTSTSYRYPRQTTTCKDSVVCHCPKADELPSEILETNGVKYCERSKGFVPIWETGRPMEMDRPES